MLSDYFNNFLRPLNFESESPDNHKTFKII